MNKIQIFLPCLLLAMLMMGCDQETIQPQPASHSPLGPRTNLTAQVAPDRVPPLLSYLIWELENELESNPTCRVLRTPNVYPNAPLTMNGVTIVDGCMKINVSYSGGCATHLFALTWDGDWIGREDLEVNLKLYHLSNGDLCEAWMTEAPGWDLSALQYPGTNSGEIKVNVLYGNNHQESTSIIYEY